MSKKLLAASGYSPEKPVKFKIQTTRGFKPKDYEMVQAIVGMWRKVGIDAEIEVYEIAKHYECAPATSSRRWRSTIGAMRSAIPDLDRFRDVLAFAAFGLEVRDLDDMIGPLWGEKDEAKRIAGWKAVDKYIAEKGYVIPLCNIRSRSCSSRR